MALLTSYQYYAGGHWHDPASGQWIESENPANGEVWARVPDCNAADVNCAVAAANAAFRDGPWGRMMPAERGITYLSTAPENGAPESQ